MPSTGIDPAVAAPARAPAGACDSHVHVIGPTDRYPLHPGRGYTPAQASLADYETVRRALGLDRVVIVQPSVYGTDNRCTLDTVAQIGPQRCRGVVVVDEAATDAELARMNDVGIRGVRCNMVGGGASIELLETLAHRIAPLGWHVELYASAEALVAFAPRLARLPVDVVVDHMGAIPTAWGLAHPAVAALRGLLESGRGWVKLCGYRSSSGGHPFDDVAPLAGLLVATAPQRCVWGTDWPHPVFDGPLPDAADLFQALQRWVPSRAHQRAILVDNPALLYGFTS